MGTFDAIRNNPAFGASVAAGIVGAGALAIAGGVLARRKKAKAKVRRKTSTVKARKSTRKTKKSTAFNKRREKAFRNASSKKIRFTKNGQPFILLKSGKARFIKKKSARLRKIRKGGFS